MKIASLAKVKARLSAYIKAARSGPVVAASTAAPQPCCLPVQYRARKQAAD